MTVTMVDVARRSGVSVATVSNVLRGTAPVAEQTRSRVQTAIDELGYRSNEVARSLKRRSTQTLGVVIPDGLNPFYAAVALQVERRAHSDGFAVLVAETENDPATEAAQVRALVGRRVDGVIFPAVTEGSAIPGELLDRGIPAVVVSIEPTDPRLGAVDIDEYAAMEEVVAHLAGLGHRRVAFAHSGEREQSIDRRPDALRRALAGRGLQPVSLDERPSAVCCTNDVTAIGLLDRLEREGTPVPERVSVVGFDDIPVAAHRRINLTTVRQDPVEMGRLAVEMVLAAIAAGEHVAERVVVSARLVVRGSTGPASGDG